MRIDSESPEIEGLEEVELNEEIFIRAKTIEALDTWVKEVGWKDEEAFLQATGADYLELLNKWFTIVGGRVFGPYETIQFKGFRATNKQRFFKLCLSNSKRILEKIISLHLKLASLGYLQHPCWAGGFSKDEGVVSQPCNVCDFFYAEERIAAEVKSVLLKKEEAIKQ